MFNIRSIPNVTSLSQENYPLTMRLEKAFPKSVHFFTLGIPLAITALVETILRVFEKLIKKQKKLDTPVTPQPKTFNSISWKSILGLATVGSIFTYLRYFQSPKIKEEGHYIFPQKDLSPDIERTFSDWIPTLTSTHIGIAFTTVTVIAIIGCYLKHLVKDKSNINQNPDDSTTSKTTTKNPDDSTTSNTTIENSDDSTTSNTTTNIFNLIAIPSRTTLTGMRAAMEKAVIYEQEPSEAELQELLKSVNTKEKANACLVYFSGLVPPQNTDSLIQELFKLDIEIEEKYIEQALHNLLFRGCPDKYSSIKNKTIQLLIEKNSKILQNSDWVKKFNKYCDQRGEDDLKSWSSEQIKNSTSMQ